MTEIFDGEAEALRRIAEEAARPTGRLSLRNLGLQRLPEALFALTHLEELDLGDESPWEKPRPNAVQAQAHRLPDAKAWTLLDSLAHAVHWKAEHDALETALKEHGPSVLGEQDFRRLKLIGAFYRHVSDILATLADTVQPRTIEQLIDWGFEDPPP